MDETRKGISLVALIILFIIFALSILKELLK